MKLSDLATYGIYASIVSTAILLVIFLASKLLFINLLSYAALMLLIISLLAFGISGALDVYSYQISNLISGKLGYNKINYSNQVTKHAGKKANLTLEVKRFNYDNKELEKHNYQVQVDKFTTVLSALIDVKSNNDHTLSVRYSCRMGICGSCAIVINGKPALACETNAMEASLDGKIVVSPMLAHPLLKDLVTDFDDFFENHKSINPSIVRFKKDEKYASKLDLKQTKEELNEFLPFSYCIMCGLCVDACPVVNTNPEFIGPQALSQVYRYHKDSRDQSGEERLRQVDNAKAAWGCQFSGSCSKVCPKGVDPASAIQMLKGDILKSKLSDDHEKNR